MSPLQQLLSLEIEFHRKLRPAPGIDIKHACKGRIIPAEVKPPPILG
jgi:hypothetical protein